MGATKIIVIRHAEKPGTYNGQDYAGINSIGAADPESLVTLGWQRAGALVTMFAPPWGPKPPLLAQPKWIYAANPAPSNVGKLPSQRPYQTVTAVAASLGLTIDDRFKKDKYPAMVNDALSKEGVVLISWQHELIGLTTKDGEPGISQVILNATGTHGTLGVPKVWPGNRYDLLFVFDRPSGEGPISGFTLVPQMLLAGDQAAG